MAVKVTRTFFDSAKVLQALPPAKRRALIKGAAFTRGVARRSMRRRKKASAPGNPPSVHVGTIKRLLTFGYDLVQQTAVVGPELFTSNTAGGAANLDRPGPGTLELGGRIETHKGQRATIEPRPFMTPALEVAAAKLPEYWRDAITPR
jgi:hypothetical protein